MYAMHTYVDDVLVNTKYCEDKKELEGLLCYLRIEDRYITSVNEFGRNISWEIVECETIYKKQQPQMYDPYTQQSYEE